MKKGDLVFLPSDLTLLQFDEKVGEESKAPCDWTRTDEPSHALLVGEDQFKEYYFQVFYKGQVWLAPKNSIYPK